MANIITAGNSTNGGTAITTDTSGTLNIVTGSGSGTTAITVDGSQNVTVAGTFTATGGSIGSIKSATAVASTSGTSIDFTSIPTGVKRITVMCSGVSTNGASIPEIRLGVSGTPETTGYSAMIFWGTTVSNTTRGSTSTSGFPFTYAAAGASETYSGSVTFSLLTGNTWTSSGSLYDATSGAIAFISGVKSLAGTLNMIRITTQNGTDTFDAGSINILYE